MDDRLRDRMLAYYNERAFEYEEAYTQGAGTASITDPAVFTTEIAVLEGIVRGFGRGHLLDVACGARLERCKSGRTRDQRQAQQVAIPSGIMGLDTAEMSKQPSPA